MEERRQRLLDLVSQLSPIDTETSLSSSEGRKLWEQDKQILKLFGIEIPDSQASKQFQRSLADTVALKIK